MQFDQLKRREFITLLGGAAVAWPIAVRAQQPAMPTIGFLSPLSPNRDGVAEFRRGLEEAGYVEGQNVAIEFRWANGRFARLPELAADLVRRQVDVIVAVGAVGAALAAKAATSTIPIVIAGGADPVRYGLVPSLGRPGGNITGVTSILNELAGKRLDLLLQLVPQATTVGYLVGDQSGEAGEAGEAERQYTSDFLAAARAVGRQVIVLECPNNGDFEAAFATLVQRQASALVVSAYAGAQINRKKIVALAALHKIPTIYPQRQYANEGGLMSYYPAGTLHQVGLYFVARILKGAKPADLPIQQPTEFRLVINAKTAEALGLTIPLILVATADEVIE
jgi:putative ABC transport system substrate-binding protein